MKKFFLILSICFSFNCYAKENLSQLNHPNEQNRFTNLIKQIRCVVCQNQSLYESNAPLAMDLRDKIFNMVKAHQSDEVIKDYLVKRYGEFILLKPRLNKFTYLLWLFPLISIFFCSIILFFKFRKKLIDASTANDFN